MDKDLVNRLTIAFEEKDYKQIYALLLKSFKIFHDFKNNLKLAERLLDFLILNKENLGLSEKDLLIERSLTRVFEQINIYSEENIRKEERDLFFKHQIRGLFFREIENLVILLTEKTTIKSASKFLIILIEHVDFNPLSIFKKILEYFIEGLIETEEFTTLSNSIFDYSPKEILKSIIIKIKEFSKSKNTETIPFYNELLTILLNYCEIYPDIYEKVIDFLFNEFSVSKEHESRYIIVQILNKLVENRSKFFISKYFDLLRLLRDNFHEISRKVRFLLEISINTLYQNEKFSIFEFFKEDIKQDFLVLLNLLTTGKKELNDVIMDFLIDYLEYSKIIYYDGKISKGLLNNYVNVLAFIVNHDYAEEYFLFSILSQLKFQNFQVDLISVKDKKDVDKRDKEKVNIIFKQVISKLREYIEIIFED